LEGGKRRAPQLQVAVFFGLQPGLGITVERVIPDARRVRHEVAVLDVFVLVAALLDAARIEHPTARVILVPDRDVLLPALTAEMQRKEPTGTVTRDELTPFKREVTPPGRFEGAIDLAAT